MEFLYSINKEYTKLPPKIRYNNVPPVAASKGVHFLFFCLASNESQQDHHAMAWCGTTRKTEAESEKKLVFFPRLVCYYMLARARAMQSLTNSTTTILVYI